MADFYPLLSRAVAGLPDAAPEKRQAIYDRARNALMAQLQAANPPLEQSAIDTELAGLAQAVQRVEQEQGGSSAASTLTAPPPAAPTPAAPIATPPATPAPAPRAPGIIIKPPPPRSFAQPQTPPAAAPVQPQPEANPPADPTPATVPASQATAPPAPASLPSGINVPAPGSSYTPPPAPAADTPPVEQAAPRLSGVDNSGIERPRAQPVDAIPKRKRMGGALVALSVLFLVAAGGIGYFSWKMRLLPASFTGGSAVATDSNASGSGNSSAGNSAGSSKTGDDSKIASRANSDKAATPASQPAPDSASKSAGASQPGNSATADKPKTTAIAVGQRAAFVIQNKDKDGKPSVKTYNGNVVWSSQNVNRGSGEPLSFTVKAEVIIPDAGFKATMTIEKNTDATLPASHMITWRFKRDTGSAIPGISDIGVLQMHDDNSRIADPLAGAQAKITPDIYIFALAAPETLRTTNMETLNKRNWLLLPVKLTDGKEARITLEKGNPGSRVLTEAFEKWGVKFEAEKQ